MCPYFCRIADGTVILSVPVLFSFCRTISRNRCCIFDCFVINEIHRHEPTTGGHIISEYMQSFEVSRSRATVLIQQLYMIRFDILHDDEMRSPGVRFNSENGVSNSDEEK